MAFLQTKGDGYKICKERKKHEGCRCLDGGKKQPQ